MLHDPEISEVEKKEEFNLFDKNADGMISTAEVHDILAILHDKSFPPEQIDLEVEDIMKKNDLDGDGFLTFAGINKLL